ncbi:MAG: hypothetical protein QOC99_2826 [Acidobacteriota bacterium]|jgi:hypothetical protein|nr:hypothetical protein [Acidobacteriota bacterium]
MSKKERATQVTVGLLSKHRGESRRITVAEARRKALEASDKAQQAQIAYAEEEAKRSYDYRVEE